MTTRDSRGRRENRWADRLLATCVALTALVGVSLVARSQPAAVHTGTRTVVGRPTAGAIDRGLRNQDPPGPAGGLRINLPGFPRASTEPFARGRVIVKFRQSADAARRAAIAASVGGVLLARPTYADFDLVRIGLELDPVGIARILQQHDDVAFAQAAYRISAFFTPNDPLYGQQWNLPAIDMERAWDINNGASSGVVVAVLDTGLAFEDVLIRYLAFVSDGRGGIEQVPVDVPFAAAPDLTGPGRFVSPIDFIWGDENPVDLDGHGTHVTGTVGQVTNNNLGVAGVAFNVRLMPIKVISGFWDEIFGAPNQGTVDVLAQGIRYAVDHGAKVLNLSLGFDSTDPVPVVDDAVRYAVDRGAFVAIAGGNEFERGNPVGQLALIASRIDGAMSVASVGRDLSRAFYSTTGSFIEIAAPGGNQRRDGTTGGIVQQTVDSDLASTFPPRFDAFAYEFFQGTSQATPHVSGLAALLIQQGITNPAAIEAAIRRFARDLGAPGRDDEYGFGLISPRTTLRGLGLAR